MNDNENSADEAPDISSGQDWFTDEWFWRTFGPLMFGPDQFSEAERQVGDLLQGLGLRLGLNSSAESVEHSPLQILDLGCGPGRHALPLARAGLKVTAVDTSAHLLDQLRDQARRQNLDMEILRQDMRLFIQPEQFDLALVMWTSFGYFDDEHDHRQVLSNLFQSLKPGGRLVLDLVGLEYLCRNLEPVHFSETEDGQILIERPTLTDDLTRLENEWILIEPDADGRESVHRTLFSHRVWSAGEITYWLKDSGFNEVAVQSDFVDSEYTLESERLIVIASKG